MFNRLQSSGTPDAFRRPARESIGTGVTVLTISRCGVVNSSAYCVGDRSGLPLSIQVLAVFRMAVTAVVLN